MDNIYEDKLEWLCRSYHEITGGHSKLLELATYKDLNDAQYEAFKASVMASSLSGVVVWRYNRTAGSTLKPVLWDLVDSPAFPFPKIEIHVKGGDKPDHRGNTFSWLLTIMPTVFKDGVDFPLGGAGSFQELDISYQEVLDSPTAFDTYWMRAKGTDNWDALELLLKLEAHVPQMTGHPVINLSIKSLLKDWVKIIDKK